VRPGHVPEHHRVTRAEAMRFMVDNFGVEVVE
jgi:hypothetical protein